MADFVLLASLVDNLYNSKDPDRDEWADWLYTNHVLWVANKAEELAKRFGVDPKLARAAGLLHDVSDAKIARDEPNSEELSLKIADDLLKQAGFEDSVIDLVVNDALRYHSCRDGESPSSDVGKILATADAMAHFQTDFYLYAYSSKLFGDYKKLKEWSAQKIERDLINKIFFEEIREEVRPQYDTLKRMLSM